MIIELHLISILLKPVHMFFDGWKECWYIFAICRNTSIFLIPLAYHMLISRVNGCLVRFNKDFKIFLPDKLNEVFSNFCKWFNRSVNLSRFAVEFWAVSWFFSNLDIIYSYKYGHYSNLFIFCEMIPYAFIFARFFIQFYKIRRKLKNGK